MELSQAQFSKVSTLVYQVSGLNLHEGKFGLVRSRLANRVRESGLSDFESYMARVGADRSGRELAMLVDALTTNKTSFFREPRHFELLRTQVCPDQQQRSRPMRIWSAGCSSGEEPYTLAMVLLSELGATAGAKVLATDISARMLDRAREGEYAEEAIDDVPAQLRPQFFQRVTRTQPVRYRVTEPVRSMVTFARLNLMAAWPMRRRFDLISCRNVMIYFDKPTQQRLVERFYEMLVPGGWFFTGHSESLAGLEHGFRYIEPATYRRPFD
jgi:chemotaxis protein methyltransferase CheR